MSLEIAALYGGMRHHDNRKFLVPFFHLIENSLEETFGNASLVAVRNGYDVTLNFVLRVLLLFHFDDVIFGMLLVYISNRKYL